MDADERAGYEELRDALGNQIEHLDLPISMGDLIDHQRVIHHYEMRRHLAREFEESRDQLSDGMRETLTNADDISDSDYADSLEAMHSAKLFSTEMFHDYDAVLTPPAIG